MTNWGEEVFNVLMDHSEKFDTIIKTTKETTGNLGTELASLDKKMDFFDFELFKTNEILLQIQMEQRMFFGIIILLLVGILYVLLKKKTHREKRKDAK